MLLHTLHSLIIPTHSLLHHQPPGARTILSITIIVDTLRAHKRRYQHYHRFHRHRRRPHTHPISRRSYHRPPRHVPPQRIGSATPNPRQLVQHMKRT